GSEEARVSLRRANGLLRPDAGGRSRRRPYDRLLPVAAGLGSPMDLDALLAQLWPGREASVEPLGGGITNHNFKVEVGGEAFVLRIGGKDTELLGIDREHEHAASVAAASLGIGPEVVAFVDGCLVTRFVEGAPV